MQSSFFDLENRHKKLDERDKLIWLKEVIDWEAFREKTRAERNHAKVKQAESPSTLF